MARVHSNLGIRIFSSLIVWTYITEVHGYFSIAAHCAIGDELPKRVISSGGGKIAHEQGRTLCTGLS